MPSVVTADASLSWRDALKPYVVTIVIAFAATYAMRKTISDPDLVERPLYWLLWFGQMMILAILHTVPLFGGAVLAHDRFGLRGWKLLAAGAVVGASSVAIGTGIVVLWVIATGSPPRIARFIAVAHEGDIGSFYIQSLRFEALFFVFAGAALAGTWEYLRRQDDLATRMRRVELEIERESERLAEARFAILNAQIEPHFLFNSLANVKHLYRADVAAADAMFESLLKYLETALPTLRENRSTLSCELALVEAYLGVQKVRMGERLRYDIDVPSPLHDAELPPLTLLTLVENAIKHGVSPRPEGGRVWISACLHERELVVAVRDDGAGLDKPFGSGAGLANVRARMNWLYGAEGRLTLGRSEPIGMIATLRLPYLPSGGRT